MVYTIEMPTYLSDKTRFGLRLSRILFNQDTLIEPKDNSIIVITGPNNSGKSHLLREIALREISKTDYGKLTSDKTINYDFDGNIEQLLNAASRNPIARGNEQWFRQPQLRQTSIIQMIMQQGMTTEAILQSMLTYMTTQTRLLELRTTPLNGINWNIPGNNQPPILKLVHENPSIENKISKLIQDAFGRRFVLNRYAFHDSKPYLLNEDIPNNIDQNSEEIVKWFEEQPLLDKQGDGVTAFCSIISNIIAAPKPMILIDEPETFLHPPQIRQLARFVAEETPKDTQIILATHSEVFVRGMIDFGTDRVDVIRLTREDQRQSVHKLSSAQLADLWQDPLLRTSNALSGLFHKVTAIVEGDSDERFLRSVIDQNFSSNKVASDLNFFHCGGKDRIVKIVSALRAIRIPTIAVLDIDVLDDKNKFYRLIAAFDGEKDKFTFDLNLVHEYIASKKSLINLGDAKQKIDEILNKKNPQRTLDRKTIDDCYVILKSASAWTQLKISGVEAWDFGEHVCALERIIGNAGSLGIIINRYGVLESLWKYGSGTKQEWLNAALTRDLKKDPRMVKAREFSKQIIEVAESIVSR